MTETTGQEPARSYAAAALSRPARQVHLAVLAAFADSGRPLTRAEMQRVARASDADPEPVFAELSMRDMIAFAADGEIRAAYPFSPSPTAIQVAWTGGPVTYAMCAIDALGMSAMLGRPVTVTAAEPGTGRVITVNADGCQARWDPRTAVVLAGSAGDERCPAADRSCGYINFFTSGRAARAWARRHPEVTTTVLTWEGALSSGVAEFGGMMRPGGK